MGGLTKKEVDELYRRTLAAALGFAREPDRAQEATQELFRRVLAGPPWSEDKPAKLDWLVPYMAHAVIMVVKDLRKTGARRARYEHAAGVEQIAIGGDAEAPAEARHVQLGEHAARKARVARVRELLAADARGLQVIDCIERGIAEPADQARELGCSIEEIYNARKRRLRAIERALAAEKDDTE